MAKHPDLKLVNLDGVPTWKLRCPLCRTWAYIDDDQYHGRVSIDCPGPSGSIGCAFHETLNLAATEPTVSARPLRKLYGDL